MALTLGALPDHSRIKARARLLLIWNAFLALLLSLRIVAKIPWLPVVHVGTLLIEPVRDAAERGIASAPAPKRSFRIVCIPLIYQAVSVAEIKRFTLAMGQMRMVSGAVEKNLGRATAMIAEVAS